MDISELKAVNVCRGLLCFMLCDWKFELDQLKQLDRCYDESEIEKSSLKNYKKSITQIRMNRSMMKRKPNSTTGEVEISAVSDQQNKRKRDLKES
mgnify:CR=1 FL=1